MPKSQNRRKSRLPRPRDSTLHRRRYSGSRHPRVSRRSMQARCNSRRMILSKKGKYCIKRTQKTSKKKNLSSCYKKFRKRKLSETKTCDICFSNIRTSYYCRGCKCDKSENKKFFHKRCLAKSLELGSTTLCPFCKNECCD